MNPTAHSRETAIVNAVRWLVSLVSIVSIAIWGFLAFAFPLPAVLVGVGAPLLALVVWALFLSPRAVLRVDAFGAAVVEIILSSAAALAMLMLGWSGWLALGLVVVSTVAGIVAGRRALGGGA